MLSLIDIIFFFVFFKDDLRTILWAATKKMNVYTYVRDSCCVYVIRDANISNDSSNQEKLIDFNYLSSRRASVNIR